MTVSFTVILVEPKGAGNIGSVCRTMMNFGVADLRLVNPQTDHLSEQARLYAVNAAERLADARIYPDLAEALADCGLSFGTTRREGKYRDGCLLPVQAREACAQLPAGIRVGLVFGRESSGLKTEELALCNRFVTIPTDSALPSMNLAQAVAVCLYEMTQASRGALPGRTHPPASAEAVEAMLAHMRQTLLAIGYLNPQNPEHLTRAFRRIFGRAQLDAREVRIMQGLWSKIDWLDEQRRREEHADSPPTGLAENPDGS